MDNVDVAAAPPAEVHAAALRRRRQACRVHLGAAAPPPPPPAAQAGPGAEPRASSWASTARVCSSCCCRRATASPPANFPACCTILTPLLCTRWPGGWRGCGGHGCGQAGMEQRWAFGQLGTKPSASIPASCRGNPATSSPVPGHASCLFGCHAARGKQPQEARAVPPYIWKHATHPPHPTPPHLQPSTAQLQQLGAGVALCVGQLHRPPRLQRHTHARPVELRAPRCKPLLLALPCSGHARPPLSC